MALMYLKPSLARKLNQDILSPIHLALQNEHHETVLRLFATDRDLVRIKGKEGYPPLHHVVREGKLDLLAQFLKDCPACIEDVTIKNETALHIAAQNNRFEALKILARWIQRTDIHSKVSRKHVLDLKDRDGNTVIHIVAANTQPQMIELLLECDVDMKETNMRGSTAFNVLESQSRSDNRERSLKILRNFDRRNRNLLKALLKNRDKSLQEILSLKITPMERAISSLLNLSAEGINALRVVLALILTATYQAMLTPPGVLPGDISRTDTVAKMGATAERNGSFITFVVINLLVFYYTSMLTVALLQIATSDSKIVILIIEVLLTALTSCLVILFQFMVPTNLVNEYKPWILTILVVVALDGSRRFPLKITTHPRVKYLKIFSEL